MAERIIRNLAGDDRDGMTLDELGRFVGDCLRASLAGNSRIKVVSRIKGAVVSIEAKEPADA